MDSAVFIHVRVTHRFSAPNKKPLAFWARGSLVLNGKLGDDLLSHGETPHYHRR